MHSFFSHKALFAAVCAFLRLRGTVRCLVNYEPWSRLYAFSRDSRELCYIFSTIRLYLWDVRVLLLKTSSLCVALICQWPRRVRKRRRRQPGNRVPAMYVFRGYSHWNSACGGVLNFVWCDSSHTCWTWLQHSHHECVFPIMHFITASWESWIHFELIKTVVELLVLISHANYLLVIKFARTKEPSSAVYDQVYYVWTQRHQFRAYALVRMDTIEHCFATVRIYRV